MADQDEPMTTSIDPMTGEVRFHVGNHAYPVDFTEMTYPDIYPHIESASFSICEDVASSNYKVYDEWHTKVTNYHNPPRNTHENEHMYISPSPNNIRESEDTHYNTLPNNICLRANDDASYRNVLYDMCDNGDVDYSTRQSKCSCIGNSESVLLHSNITMDTSSTATRCPMHQQNYMKYSLEHIGKTIHGIDPVPNQMDENSRENGMYQSNENGNTSPCCSYSSSTSESGYRWTWPTGQTHWLDNEATVSEIETSCRKSLMNLDTQTFICQTESHSEQSNNSCHYNNSQSRMNSCWYKQPGMQAYDQTNPNSVNDRRTPEEDTISNNESKMKSKLEKLELLRSKSLEANQQTNQKCMSSNRPGSTAFFENLPCWYPDDQDNPFCKVVHAITKTEFQEDAVCQENFDEMGNGYLTEDIFLTTHIHSAMTEETKSVPRGHNIRSSRTSALSARKLKRGCRLWEFIRNLLLDPSTNPALIRWENRSDGTFKLVQSKQIAHIWGMKKGNEGMNYEKLSRAMRYYYKRKIFAPVLGKRLVYMFGPRATGWRAEEIKC